MSKTLTVDKEPINKPTNPLETPYGQLNPQQLKFAQCVANGLPLKEAGRIAHYSPKSLDTQPSQIVRNPKVQAKIQELINKQSIFDAVAAFWIDELTYRYEKEIHRIKGSEIKLKVIDQLARLGGWNPSEVSESVKKVLNLNASVSDLLPPGIEMKSDPAPTINQKKDELISNPDDQ